MQNDTKTKEEACRQSRELRNAMVEDNVGLIYMVLRRFGNRGYDMEDLFQVGAIGLLKAAERFDRDRGLAFSTYAVPLIIGEIKRFLRDDGIIHVSRQIRENARAIAVFREAWKKEKNIEPTLKDMQRELNMDKESVIMAVESGYAVESIDRPVALGRKKEDGEIRLMDQLAADIDEQENRINALAIKQMLEELDYESRELIRLRYLCGLTQMQVAKQMGMNQVAVSRMEKKILLQLRKRV